MTSPVPSIIDTAPAYDGLNAEDKMLMREVVDGTTALPEERLEWLRRVRTAEAAATAAPATPPGPPEAFGPREDSVPLSALRDVEAQRDQARVERDQAQHTARVAAQRLEAFGNRVRVKALEVAADQGWCRAGLNEALRDLDLAPYPDTFEVEVVVTARQTVRVRVEADDITANGYTLDADGAAGYVKEDSDGASLVAGVVDSDAWEWDQDGIEPGDVEAITPE